MRALAPLLALLLATSAAAMPPRRAAVLQPAQQPVLDLDFTHMTTFDPRIFFNRTSPLIDYNCANPPTLVTRANDVPDWGVCDPKTGTNLGLGIWMPVTISNRWSSDLTQTSYWIKTNTTAALNATSASGVANAASQVSATADGGTICTVVIGGQFQRVFSAFVRRSGGTGAVYISGDQGNSWTPIDGALNNTTYTRVPAGGLYSTSPTPSICFKLAKNGDAIHVDLVNAAVDSNEHYSEPSPPVATTSGANTQRADDRAWLDLSKVPNFDPRSFTTVIKFMPPVWAMPGGPEVSARRTFLQVDDGTAFNGWFGNMQADAYPPSVGCDPVLTPGAIPNCHDYNYGHIVDNSALADGKVRCVNNTTTNITTSYVPPRQGLYGVVAHTNLDNGFDSITCNNGAPPEILANGYFMTAGDNPVLSFSGPVPVASLPMRRLVFGSAPVEAISITGSITAGDVLSVTTTWSDPPGTPQTATATYTTVGGDTTATALAALAAAITAAPAYSSAGFSASIRAGQINVAHPMKVMANWVTSVTGAKTENLLSFQTSAFACNCYILRVQVYSPALSPGQLTTALMNTTPGVPFPTHVALQRGGVAVYRSGAQIPCNRC